MPLRVEAPAEIVGGDELSEVPAQLVVAVVMIAL